MTNPAQHFTSRFRGRLRTRVFALAMFLAVTVLATQSAEAQTYTVLHDFSGGADGGNPASALTFDAAGNLYGTAEYGGLGYGTVFKLARKNSAWVISTLYTFQAGNDGSFPFAGVTFGPDGALYGTTFYGGGTPCRDGNGALGCGTVYKLTPPATICKSALCPWTETVLYRFQGGTDATYPLSSVTFDQAGNLYGTTEEGGSVDYGTVYELVHSGGGWSETILHSFSGNDGREPYSGVIFDAVGNLYGTTPIGGQNCGVEGCGVVYQLSPSGSGWVETVLALTNGEYSPYGGVILGPLGVLYGTSIAGGFNDSGTVFEVSRPHGTWGINILYSLSGNGGSTASPTMDAAGNLYGTAEADPSGDGAVFELTQAGGNWTFNYIHVFSGDDGASPYGSVVVDAAGNIYGTANGGGSGQLCNQHGGCGVIWEITP